MNKVILMGRLTRDPDITYAQNEKQTCIARYTLAVDRRKKRDEDAQADFINCVAFGRSGEFAEKYFYKGIKIAVTGRIQTGSYVNKEGRTVYTTDVVVEEQEFAESKASSQGNAGAGQSGGYQNQSNGYRNGGYQNQGYQQPQAQDNNGGFLELPDDDVPF